MPAKPAADEQEGDVFVRVVRHGSPYCSFWLHTSFLHPGQRRFTLPKPEVDKMHKDLKKHKRAPPSFAVHLDYCIMHNTMS